MLPRADRDRMAVTQLTTEPTTIRAGDSLSWLISVSDYPADLGWTLKYNLVNADAVILLTSVASGADHAITATAAVTAAYTSGDYTAVKFVESGVGASLERVTLSQFNITVLPSLTTATAATDTRTAAKRWLDSITAVLDGSATKAIRSQQFDGKSLERYTVMELLDARARLQQEVTNEEATAAAANGTTSGGRLFMRL